jgi:hypothetical protein
VPESRIRVEAMTDGERYISPPPEADGPYKYYRLYATPVRVTLGDGGRFAGAEAPDLESGALRVAHSLLGRIEDGVESEEITRDEFIARCRWAGEGVKSADGEYDVSIEEVIKMIPSDCMAASVAAWTMLSRRGAIARECWCRNFAWPGRKPKPGVISKLPTGSIATPSFSVAIFMRGTDGMRRENIDAVAHNRKHGSDMGAARPDRAPA